MPRMTVWRAVADALKAEGLEREFALVFLLAALSYVVGANFSDYRNAQFCNTTIFLLFGAVAGIEATQSNV